MPSTEPLLGSAVRGGAHAGITLGLLVDRLEDDYQNVVLRGAIDAARERDVNLACFAGGILGLASRAHVPPRSGVQRNAIYELAGSGNADGLMILSGTLGNHIGVDELRRFCERYRPLPMCSIAVALPGMPSVVVDNAAGMRAAVVHLLLDHGVRRIAFVRGPRANEEAEGRYRIYRDVLTEYGLPLDPRLVVMGEFQRSSGADAVRELYDERNAAPDAIVAASDYMALGVMEALATRGIRVPADVAVVGFDDVEEARSASPPLTTVRQPLFEQGRWAVEVLLDCIHGRRTPERVLLHTEFVRRRTCGCAAGGELVARDVEGGDSGTAAEIAALEDAVFTQARQRLATRRWARTLADTGEALLTTFDVGALVKAVSEQLPRLGIACGYLALYEGEGRPSEESRLILAYDRDRPQEPESPGRLFRSRELVPEALRPTGRRFAWVVEPLFVKDEQLGFAVFELGPAEGIIYEALRDHVSGALKSALLLQEVIQKDRERQRLLRYIVEVTPDMHRIQPLDDLFERILDRLAALFGPAEHASPGAPSRRVPGGVQGFLVATGEGTELVVRAATGRFAELRRAGGFGADLLDLCREALACGEVQITRGTTVVPLRVGEQALGAIYIDRPALSEGDVELLRIFSNQAAAAVQNVQLYEMAALDPLTGAYARRFFDDWLRRELRAAFRKRGELSFLMVDMDNLKGINDTAGHLFGDQALAALAKVLRQATRDSDVIGRFGGDEFSIILPQTGAAGASSIAERILELLRGKVFEDLRGRPVPLRCSLGLSTLRPHDFNQEEIQGAVLSSYFQEVGTALIRCADEALYGAKKKGGATVSAGAPTAWLPLGR